MTTTMMTRDELVKAIGDLTPEQVTGVYSGRPGCGCGCRGHYYKDARNIKRVLKAMRANAIGAERIAIEDGVAVVEGDRYYWAYLVEARS